MRDTKLSNSKFNFKSDLNIKRDKILINLVQNVMQTNHQYCFVQTIKFKAQYIMIVYIFTLKLL